MKTPYYVLVDVEEDAVRKEVIDDLCATNFIDQLCIIESNGLGDVDGYKRVPFDLVVCDFHDSPDRRVATYCSDNLDTWPEATFLNIGDYTFVSEDLHLIGITATYFSENYKGLLGSCFIRHIAKEEV